MTSQAWLYLLFGASIVAAAVQTQAGWLFVMGGVTMATVVLAALLAWLNGTRLKARLLDPGPAWQGGLVHVPVVLENPGPWAATSVQAMIPPKRPGWFLRLWRDALVPEGWPYATADVAAGGRADATLDVPAPRRGEFPLPDVVLQSAWPLGLVAWWRLVATDRRYLVYPVGPRLTDVPWLAAALARQGAAARVTAGHGQLLRGVREYQTGDAWRQIHWRTTARLGVPHVKETEREAGEALVLWLDLRASVHTPETLEHMIAVATSLATYGREAGRLVRLVTQPGAEPAAEGRPGDPALVWLALARATAPDDGPGGPEGCVAISPVPVPGWRAWASALVCCPPAPGPGLDATAVCPVGADIPPALAEGRIA